MILIIFSGANFERRFILSLDVWTSSFEFILSTSTNNPLPFMLPISGLLYSLINSLSNLPDFISDINFSLFSLIVFKISLYTSPNSSTLAFLIFFSASLNSSSLTPSDSLLSFFTRMFLVHQIFLWASAFITSLIVFS